MDAPFQQGQEPSGRDRGGSVANPLTARRRRISPTLLVTFFSSKKLGQHLRGFYKNYFWELRKGTDPEKAVDIVF